MTARQVLNFAYAVLCQGRSKAEKAELDAVLASPEEREKALAKMNKEAMQQLGSFGLLAPPPKPRKT